MIIMAAEQLSARRGILSEQLLIAAAHLNSVIMKINLINDHSAQLCDSLSREFTILKQALDKKEKELISKIHSDSALVKGDIELATKSAKLIIDKSSQVMYGMLYVGLI